MPRRRGPPRLPPGKPAMPRRRRPPRFPPGEHDRRLAEEVLYLHSLWRCGPPAPATATARIQSRSTHPKITKRKRRRFERAAAAEPEDTGPAWPLAPSPAPSTSPKSWPEAAPASSPPAQPPPSPGPLAQRYALRASVEFFSSRAASDDGEDYGSESEGEQDAAGFFTGMFERDAALRGHYERRWEEGQFPCMVCAAGTRKAGRRFEGCAALVQHARAATRYGRPRAHRALAAVLCRVLGWDIERLPSIVIDPRGTLGQALASRARADVQAAKENDDTGKNSASLSDEDEEKEDAKAGAESTDGDEDANGHESGEESTGKDDVETRMEDSSTDDDGESNELVSSEEPAEKEDAETGAEDSKAKSTDVGKEAMELDDSKKIAEKVNSNMEDDYLIQGNNGEVHEQEIAKESVQQEGNIGEDKEEHADKSS